MVNKRVKKNEQNFVIWITNIFLNIMKKSSQNI